MENTNTLTYIVIGFLIVNLIVGLWAGRGVKTIEDYAVGKKKWSTGLLVTMYISTMLTGGAVLRGPTNICNLGIYAISGPIGYCLFLPIRYYFFSKSAYSFKTYMSVGDIFEDHYGKLAKIISGFLTSFFSIIQLSMELCALSLIFQKILLINSSFSIVASCAILCMYTIFGGIQSSLFTSALKFIFLALAVFIISNISLTEAGGAIKLFSSEKINKLFLIDNKNIPYFVSMFFLNSLFSTDTFWPASLQRIFTAKNPNQLKKIFLFSGISWLVFAFTLVIIALSINTLSGGEENSIFFLLEKFISPKYKIIVSLGLISFILSSGNAFLHSAGISVYNDLLKPIFNTKDSLLTLRMTTVFLCVFSIYFSFHGAAFFRLDYVLGIIAPTLCAPLTFIFLGKKLEKKSFYFSGISGVMVFFISKFGILGNFIASFSVLIGSFMSIAILVLFFLKSHNINFNVIKTKSVLSSKKGNTIVSDSLNNMEYNIYYNSSLLFGIFYSIFLMIPYFFYGNNFKDYRDIILNLRLFGIIFCSMIAMSRVFPNFLKKYFNLLWEIGLIYCLPFLSITMFILTKGSLESMLTLGVNIMILFFLVSAKKSFKLIILSLPLSIVFCKLLGIKNIIFSFESKYFSIYQILVIVIVGFLFARKRDLLLSNLSFRSFFQNFFNQETINSNIRSLAIIDETKKSYKDFMLDPEQEISKITKNLQSKNYDQVEKGILVLEEFIKANKKELIPYCALNVSKVNINNFTEDIQKMIEALGIKNLTIENYTESNNISCDKIGLLKALWKFTVDYLSFKAKNYDDDYYLALIVKDVIINYTINGKSVRKMEAMSVILAEDGLIDSEEIKNVYDLEIPDPEKIPPVGIYDEELSDIENIIYAHYGNTINLTQNQDFGYQVVIPKNVGEIRPVTLDLRAPIDSYYNWPPAEKLEKEFWTKINNNFSFINLENVKQAVNVIKTYHFHQTRKSGEPYYLHPISVSMMAMDIILDKESKIYSELNKDSESIILASLLHDILEDTAMREVALNNIFGVKVVDYVKEVTKIDYKERHRVLSNSEAFTKLIEQNHVPVCIKLADRLHNLMTIDGHPKVEKRKAVAQETLDFFVPPAEKFGLKNLEKQLREGAKYVLQNGKIEGWK